MAKRPGYVFVDAGPFIIDLAFPADKRAGVNSRFLERLKLTGRGVVSWSVSLEVAGALSFHSTPERTARLAHRLPALYGLYAESFEKVSLDFGAIAARICKRMKLGDAAALTAAETSRRRITHLVTWNAKDFKNRTALHVCTPQEFLRQPF